MKYKRFSQGQWQASMGNQNYGIDPESSQYALKVRNQKLGIRLAIVIGGGNIYRGVQAEHAGIDQAQFTWVCLPP